MTTELMHFKRHGWSRNSQANQTAEIHEVALMFKDEFRKQILKSIDFKHKIPDQRQIYKTKTLQTSMITKANAVYMCTVSAVSI